MSETGTLQILSQGVSYGIIVGIGIFFALVMLLLTHLQNRFTSYSSHAVEEFAIASRSVKPGSSRPASSAPGHGLGRCLPGPLLRQRMAFKGHSIGHASAASR
jgi:hypothetical protein